MTREEIEQQRDLLKVYFPNESSERHAFNRICDLAVKGLKSTPPEVGFAKVPVKELEVLTIECCTSTAEPTVEELELKLDTIRDWAERYIPAGG